MRRLFPPCVLPLLALLVLGGARFERTSPIGQAMTELRLTEAQEPAATPIDSPVAPRFAPPLGGARVTAERQRSGSNAARAAAAAQRLPLTSNVVLLPERLERRSSRQSILATARTWLPPPVHA